MRNAPMVLTIGNALCGIAAIYLLLYGNVHYLIPGIIILAGSIFDLFDGKLARKLGVTSQAGAYADMISDAISFGLAPAIFIYKIEGDYLGLAGAIIYGGLIFTRLIRFKVAPPPVGTFYGVPSPSAALPVVAVCMLTAKYGLVYAAPIAGIFWGILAISKIPYPGFSHPAVGLLPKFVSIIIWVVHFTLLFFFTAEAILSFFIIYLFLGPALFSRYSKLQENSVGKGDTAT